ncbi:MULTISPECIES: spore coat protein U domain-containing protein [Symbiopectobacterium]|uniref:spore coat protein U domain-containing protein n=1 Tax=Symbiopectobacterium TaxID=801 RepID=UPI001A32D3DC|nr:hypothetical protein [Candidatus Symbiopectobacterium sp. PLON1]MBT9429525.1 spore coat protein U domain-containing protein [Candidatus Symbiopectobacterium endolongispinus]
MFVRHRRRAHYRGWRKRRQRRTPSYQRRRYHHPTLISYRLYSNSARSTEIAIGGTISVPAGTGVAQAVPIYGRIVASEQTLKYPPAGNYTDTITATLTWN